MDRKLFQQALSCDNESTPGYILEKIVQSSFVSPEICHEFKDTLLKGLSQDFKKYDPFVKLKYLRVIRHLCEKGNPEFRIALQRRADEVKALLSYNAPLDILRGDSPVREVRQEADRCIKLMYGSEGLQSQSAESRLYVYTQDTESLHNNKYSQSCSPTPVISSSSPYFNRIEGFGNTTFHTNYNDSCGGSINNEKEQFPFRRQPHYEGFGNTHLSKTHSSLKNYHPATTMSSISEVVVNQAEQLVSQAAAVVGRFLPETVRSHIDNRFTTAPPRYNGQHPAIKHYNFSGDLASGPIQNNYASLGMGNNSSNNKETFGLTINRNNYNTATKRWGPVSLQPTPLSLTYEKNQDSTLDSAALLLIFDAIEAACPTRCILHKYDFTPIGKLVSQYPHPEHIVALLLKKLEISSTIQESLNSIIQRPITVASTWQAKVNVLNVLIALIGSDIINSQDCKEQFFLRFKELALPKIKNIVHQTPKCKETLRILLDLVEPAQTEKLIDDGNQKSQLSLLDELDILDEEKEAASHNLEQSASTNDLLLDSLEPSANISESTILYDAPTSIQLQSKQSSDEVFMEHRNNAPISGTADTLFQLEESCINNSSSALNRNPKTPALLAKAATPSSSLFSGLTVSSTNITDFEPKERLLLDINKPDFAISQISQPSSSSSKLSTTDDLLGFIENTSFSGAGQKDNETLIETQLKPHGPVPPNVKQRDFASCHSKNESPFIDIDLLIPGFKTCVNPSQVNVDSRGSLFSFVDLR